MVQNADQVIKTFVLDVLREWASSLFHCTDKPYTKTTKRDVELKCSLCIRVQMGQGRFMRAACATGRAEYLAWCGRTLGVCCTYPVSCRSEPSMCAFTSLSVFCFYNAIHLLYEVCHSNNTYYYGIFNSKCQAFF